MVDPRFALAAAIAIVTVLILALWPDRGLLWRARRALQASERVLIEDALKHFFDCEYKGLAANLHSLAGALGVTGQRAAEIIHQLEATELVRAHPGGYELTEEGRSYALRIVRIHRLWERYLAEETGYEPAVWHQEAELREHRTSTVEAEALAVRMGNPRYDPHGDPIPTASGEIRPPVGRALTELGVGSVGEIVHLEDEPEAVFAQLVAEGLHPGQRIRILEKTPRRIRFEADAEEHILAPVLAANLSVRPLSKEASIPGPYTRLSSLEPGQRARVVAVLPTLRPPERRRLLDLGLVPGTEVSVELRSPAGDPTGYRIRGAVIALRREQADQVQIEP